MGYPIIIAKRIIFNAQPSFSRFIIRLSVAATALSVATMIITLSLVNGFQRAVSEKVYSFWGHARVQGLDPFQSVVTDDDGIALTDSILQAVASTQSVSRFHSFAVKSVILRNSSQFEGVLLKGVDFRFQVASFNKFILAGEFPATKDSLSVNGVLISQYIANRMQLSPGDSLQCLFIRNGQDIRSRPIKVTGIFKTGIEEYDKNFALGDISFLRKLNLWDSSIIGGVEVFLKNPAYAIAAADTISQKLPYYVSALSMQEISPNIFDWLAIQNQTKTIVIIIMLVVAIINLVTCLLILVMERTHMVGVLKSLGMQDGKIGMIFWMYAGWIAVLGIGLGLLLGVGLCYLQQTTQLITMDEATYYVATAPIEMVPMQIVAVALGSFMVCILSIRLPLLFLQRVSPVKAIRFD